MLEPLVTTAHQGAVRTITLNRPQALNSFTTAMHAELASALRVAAADDTVRCVVLTGAGRAFCAGQDLADPSIAPGSASGEGSADVGGLIERHYKPLGLLLRAMPVPVVAAVNGVAAGAGASLALGCDLVVATRSASFIQSFAKIGLVPDFGGTWLLPRLVGRARALGLAMTGERLSATDAVAMGMIWKCVDDALFAAEVASTAEHLAGLPTRALVAARAAIDAAMAMDYAAAMSHEGRQQAVLAAAPDFREGVDAFLQKRAPRFTDR
jgi:2-(1,2-epoxy-1,2-dihydrophenyl)acetyl-CoA isomerase